jgi:hypothetical protein
MSATSLGDLQQMGSFVDNEVIVKLADGWTIRSGVYKPDDPEATISGEYVRLCDPEGAEYLYYDQAEWEEDPATVMGAFINAAAGLRGLKEKIKCEECPLKPGFPCAGYHYQ